MEPVTHFLTGAVLARAGLNRRAAYATLVMTIAAELPDIDYVYRLGGPLVYFQHHRGWTHSLWGIVLEAFLLTWAIYWLHTHGWTFAERIFWKLRGRPNLRMTTAAWDELRSNKHIGIAARYLARWQRMRERPAAPIHWPWLFTLALIALLSHILLDYTNNYGVRPFAPFNPRWYEASIVFIAEPLIWIVLLLALILPSIFGLVGSEIGAKKKPFRGQGFAIAALTFMAVLWLFRSYEHSRALQIAQQNEISGQPILRVDANPYPITPFKWQVLTETPMFYRIGEVNTQTGEEYDTEIINKPPTTLATLAAKRSWLGEIYLNWAKFPLVQEVAKDPTLYSTDPTTEVTFDDLRFRYPTSFLNGRMHRPLGAAVLLDKDRKVVRTLVGENEQ